MHVEFIVFSLGRSKKVSNDFGSRGKASLTFDSPRRGAQSPQPSLPSVVVSKYQGDDDDILTSGQVSPVCEFMTTSGFYSLLMTMFVADAHIRGHLMLGLPERAERSEVELAEFNRRLTEFNQKNPPTKPHLSGRIISWAGPKTTRDKEKLRMFSPLGKSESARSSEESLIDVEPDSSRATRRRLQTLTRRRSFDDADSQRLARILPIERMRIDIELAGQVLIMRRREAHLANVLACLNALTTKLSASNSQLHTDYISKQDAIEAVKARAAILQDIEEARTRADAMTQETNALAYESAQFLVEDLWHMAAGPRLKVLEMRERVFGVGKRLPRGVRGAHGPFHRQQWTLGGEDRLVDALGRTESEAEEEYGLPGVVLHQRDEADEVEEHANLKPTWLLRMFHYWGSKWGAGAVPKDKGGNGHSGHAEGMSRSVSLSSSSDSTMVRNTMTRSKTAS